MRKPVAIFLLLCANLVLLTHAVVPHHHHDDIACFILPVEEGHDNCCDHSTPDHQEKHDANTGDDCCILNDILAIVPDNYKQENLAFDFTSDEFTSHYLSIVLSQEGYDEPLCSLKTIQQPYLLHSYEVYAAHSLGLRGPPSC